MAQQLLQHYLVLGLHQQKNNAASLAALTAAGAEFISYQQIFVRQQLSWQQALDLACDKVLSAHTPLALELALQLDGLGEVRSLHVLPSQ